MTEDTEQILRGCRTLVRNCADLKAGESALIISDEQTQAVGEAIEKAARLISPTVIHRVIAPLQVHGQEPPQEIAEQMPRFQVVFAVTAMSLAHSKARRRASRGGTRFLSLPDYSLDVLAGEALQADFRSLTPQANSLAALLTDGQRLVLRTAAGTELYCSLQDRTAIPAPGWCWAPGTLASPPDAETNIAPIEDATEGTLVVDGSIPCPQIGLLSDPVVLTIESGRVTSISGKQAQRLQEVFESAESEAARVVGEIGFGLNPSARLCGSMLEDEGCRGTAHVGIGSNATIGGKNDVSFHLDHVIRDVTAEVDGRRFMVDGKFL